MEAQQIKECDSIFVHDFGLPPYAQSVKTHGESAISTIANQLTPERIFDIVFDASNVQHLIGNWDPKEKTVFPILRTSPYCIEKKKLDDVTIIVNKLLKPHGVLFYHVTVQASHGPELRCFLQHLEKDHIMENVNVPRDEIKKWSTETVYPRVTPDQDNEYILPNPPKGYGLGRNDHGYVQTNPLTINDVMGTLFCKENVRAIKGSWDGSSVGTEDCSKPYVFLRTRPELMSNIHAATAVMQINEIINSNHVTCECVNVTTEYGYELQFQLVVLRFKRKTSNYAPASGK